MKEARKRFSRLWRLIINKKKLVKGRDVYLVALLTIIDVASIVRSLGLIHPHYLIGSSRVSCIYCPYKSAYELRLKLGKVEDEGLIEDILRYEWRRWYRDLINDFNIFFNEHLWRYVPRVAHMFLKLKETILKFSDRYSFEEVDVTTIRNYYRLFWSISYDVFKHINLSDLPKVIGSIKAMAP